jgi:hypothetical protein
LKQLFPSKKQNFEYELEYIERNAAIRNLLPLFGFQTMLEQRITNKESSDAINLLEQRIINKEPSDANLLERIISKESIDAINSWIQVDTAPLDRQVIDKRLIDEWLSD